MNGNGYPMTQQPQQQQPPQQMTREQYDQYVAHQQRQQALSLITRRMAYIKSELHQSMNIYSLRDRVRELAELVEYALTGQISDAQPNVVPGTPAANIDDPTKTRVEFTSGPGAAMQHQQRNQPQPLWQPNVDPFAPQQAPLPRQTGPVNSGDVQFIPGPPPGVSTGVGGQTVEYVDQYGRQVDSQGRLLNQGVSAPELPRNPVSNQPPAIVPSVQSRSVEAGGQVLPPPSSGFMSSPAAGEIFPGNPAPPPVPGAPTTLEEARQVLPIPIAE